MDNENITKTALRKVEKYIDKRLEGHTKGESVSLAGYSPRTNPANVENTKAYAYAINKILSTNRDSIDRVGDMLADDIDNGKIDSYTPKDKAFLMKTLADIHKILTPQVTIKDEQLKDGTIKRTVWGQGSVSGNEIQD